MDEVWADFQPLAQLEFIGHRLPLPKQIEFKWGYLWAEVEVLSGEVNVWLVEKVDKEVVALLVEKMAERWGQKVAIVWDNAKAHQVARGKLPCTFKAIFLPPYSPELNPVERLFEELRRKVANRVFESLEELEAALVEALKEYWDDREKVRKLCGYEWIVAQLQSSQSVY